MSICAYLCLTLVKRLNISVLETLINEPFENNLFAMNFVVDNHLVSYDLGYFTLPASSRNRFMIGFAMDTPNRFGSAVRDRYACP